MENPGLHLALGPNSADIKGELGVKDLNLDATIDAPHLDNALPGLGGTAKGLGKKCAALSMRRSCWPTSPPGALRWQEADHRPVNVKGDVKSTDQIGGNLDVRVDRISQPGVNISLVQLNAKGTEKQHELRLRVQGDPVSGQLALAGSFDRQA